MVVVIVNTVLAEWVRSTPRKDRWGANVLSKWRLAKVLACTGYGAVPRLKEGTEARQACAGTLGYGSFELDVACRSVGAND